MSNGGVENFQMQVQWLQDGAAVPMPVNQFMIQAGPGVSGGVEPDLFTVTLGHVTPPVVPTFTSREEAEAFGQAMSAFVVPVARLSFTPERLREFRNILTQVLNQNGQE